MAIGRLSRVPQTYLQLKAEIARRLKELRRTATNNLSPEVISANAKENGLSISARTIRDYEDLHLPKNETDPSVKMLHALLSYYNVTIGEFFRFTVEDDDGKLVAEFQDLCKRPGNKKMFKELFRALRGR